MSAVATHPPAPAPPDVGDDVDVEGLDAVGRPAVLWRRAAARLLDAAVVFFVLWALVVLRVLWFMGPLAEDVDPQPWGTAFAPTVAFVVLSFAYEVVYLVRNEGRTPGKERLGVRVVRDGTGGPIGPARALARTLLPVVIWLASPAVLALGLLLAPATSVPFSRRRAAWHDHLSGTAVVHDDSSDDDGDDDE
jgi:uncharacterized RDD family membrane protein YckC